MTRRRRSRPGTDYTTFLQRLTQKHDVAKAELFVDSGGYLTALARYEVSGRLNYRTRNHMEKEFQL